MASATTPPAGPAPDGGAQAEHIFNVVLGTAGHIDHGKSALVEALTGIHPDRLKEEQERGITIDIGFAPMELSNGLRVNIIDVPGHERFVKNMVAGAHGIDFVMLVVAADDGVMAQTREHLQIIRLLGVPDGLVVISKTDLVEPAFVELVRDEVRQLVAGTCLEGKPILPFSAKTKAGLAELRAELEQSLSRLRRRAGTGPFRLPIQRVFAKEGFGTVLTGVTISGTVAIGETLEILPPGCRGRVKGLQAYGRKISRARAGHSTAVNLAGVERQSIIRGMEAVAPGIYRPTRLAAAHLLHLPDAPYPLKHRAAVRFHAGTAEIMGKVLLLEGDQLAVGAQGYVQVLLEEPAVLAPGDRFILRHQSPVVTLGGGQILDNAPAKRKRFSAEAIGELAVRRECLGRPEEFAALLLDSAPGPKSCAEMCAEMGLLPGQVQAMVAALEAAGRAMTVKPAELFIGARAFEILRDQVVRELEGFFAEHPALGAIERPELRARLDRARKRQGAPEAAWLDDLLSALEARGVLRCSGNQVSLPGRERKLDAQWAGHARKVEEALRAGGLAPPSTAEIQAATGVSPKALSEVLRYLTDTGRAVLATPEIYFHAEAYAGAEATVRAMFARAAELTVSEIRQQLGMNRKFVVPLVETMDRRGLTVRVGDKRRLAPERQC
jgi:selenocysteine-specific elongation factor